MVTLVPQQWLLDNGCNVHVISILLHIQIFVNISQKLCDVCDQKLVSTIGTTDTPSFFFCQKKT